MKSENKNPFQAKAPVPDVLTAGRWYPQNNICFEQVQDEKFLDSRGLLERGHCIEEDDDQNTGFAPLPNKQILWPLCTQTPAKYDKPQLWQTIKQYIYKHIDLPDERLYDILTAWIFANWIPEKWNTVPYLYFYSSAISGKTRALSILQNISYRSVFGVCYSPLTLLDIIDKHNITLFIDDIDICSKKENPELTACLNAGYKRETGFVQYFQGDAVTGKIRNFRVFGFKAIAGNFKPQSTFVSRSIIVRMAKNTRDIKFFTDKIETQTIRDQLLQWRFWALKNLTITDTEEAQLQALPDEFKAMLNSRVLELFLPLYLVADDDVKPVIAEYAQNVYHSSQNEVKTP